MVVKGSSLYWDLESISDPNNFALLRTLFESFATALAGSIYIGSYIAAWSAANTSIFVDAVFVLVFIVEPIALRTSFT